MQASAKGLGATFRASSTTRGHVAFVLPAVIAVAVSPALVVYEFLIGTGMLIVALVRYRQVSRTPVTLMRTAIAVLVGPLVYLGTWLLVQFVG